MAQIDTIYLCFEGMLVPQISQMISDYLLSAGDQISPELQIFLVDQDRKLYLGKSTFSEYLEAVSLLVNRRLDVQTVSEWIAKQGYWDDQAGRLIAELEAKRVIVVCGMPELLVESWAQELAALPIEEILYTPQLYLKDYFNSILERVIQENLRHPEQVLWIDPHPFRTTRMIRKGGNALIYVDPTRTRRELVMRKVLID